MKETINEKQERVEGPLQKPNSVLWSFLGLVLAIVILTMLAMLVSSSVIA